MEREELLKKVERVSLPSLSPISMKLIELASDERASASDLAKIIEKDPSLATRILKLANSVIFARKRKVSTIIEAVTLLGFKRVRIMALGISLKDSLPSGKLKDMDYDLFFKSSLYRALVSQRLSLESKTANPDEAFILALLSEVGLLFLSMVLDEKIVQKLALFLDDFDELIRYEKENIGITHREVGEYLFSRWNFPDEFSVCQKCFGRECLACDFPKICKICELGRWASEILFGEKREQIHLLVKEVESSCSISEERFYEILSEIFDQVELTAAQFMIEANSKEDMYKVIEKAKEELLSIEEELEEKVGKVLGEMETEVGKREDELVKNALEAIAHEIRNPLLSLSGFAKRLINKIEDANKAKMYADIVIKEAKRLDLTLKEMIEFCKSYKPFLEKKDIKEVFLELISDLKRIQDAEIEVLEEPESISFFIDKEAFKEAILSLMRATLKVAKKSVKLSCKRENDKIVFTIIFFGVGKDKIEVLKNPLFSQKTFGYGFGFINAKRIITTMGGQFLDKMEDDKLFVKVIFSLSKE